MSTSQSAQQQNQKDAAPSDSRSLFLAHPVTHLIGHDCDHRHTFVITCQAPSYVR